MTTLKIQNVSKIYQLKNGVKFYALKDINLEFPNNGLVSIVGKSGSGKSTLLNLIAMLDTPSEGEIYLKERSYSSIKRKERPEIYQNDIGIVFQNFNLIEDKSVLYNVELPLLIKGEKKNRAKELASQALMKVGLNEEQFDKPANELSGGEQQRVAIARAIVNKPKVLLCDEPTGHLDISNSIKVMEILKKISKERLVILVSHNLPLVKQYSDEIITLKDGQVIGKESIKKLRTLEEETNLKTKHSASWTKDVFVSNFRKRLKRNIFTSLCLVVSFTMFILVMGFINGKDSAIRNTCYQQLDFGSGSISQEEKVSGTGVLSLTKSIRPNYEELKKNEKIDKLFEICPNFSTIIYQNLSFEYDGTPLNNLNYNPIYSFKGNSIDKSLIIDGYIPKEDTLKEVVINQFARQTIKKKIGKDPLGEYLNLKVYFTNTYITEYEEYIQDNFVMEKQIRVVGVVKELKYLNSEKIYYSNVAMEDQFHSSLLPNLSTYFGYDISWYDYVMNSSDISMITSYSYNLFLKDYLDKSIVIDPNFNFGKSLNFTSESLLVSKSLQDFMDVAQYGVILFMIIASIGSILILGIMSFVSYSEDRKLSAIFTFLGARDGDIFDIYLGESMLSGLISFVVSLGVSIGFEHLLNYIIFNVVEVKNIISIPFLSFLGVRFLYPIVLLAIIGLIVFLATSIPISFSKLKKVKEELQSL